MTIVITMVVMRSPICPAFLYAFREEYNRNGWASRLMISQISGYFNAIAIWAVIVKNGMRNWEELLISSSFFCSLVSSLAIMVSINKKLL